METSCSILLKAHVFTGFISLILFWLPIFLKKGSPLHNRIGRYYVYMMWVVVGTAILLSIRNFIIGKTIMASFLGFIALITAKPLWHGRVVLKIKKNQTIPYRNTLISFQILIIFTSIAMIAYGIYLNGEGAAMLMFFFGALGITDIPVLIKTIKNANEKINWLKEHISAMIISGIAAYTAFLVFGARTFLEAHLNGMWSIIPWVMPTLIGVVSIKIALKKYDKKGS